MVHGAIKRILPHRRASRLPELRGRSAQLGRTGEKQSFQDMAARCFGVSLRGGGQEGGDWVRGLKMRGGCFSCRMHDGNPAPRAHGS
jgi:hypothetical protein